MLLLDVQATSSDPARGALLELAWAWFAAHVVAPPPGATLPRAVARVTGLGHADWSRGIDSGEAFDRLRQALMGLAACGAPVPAVIHFARFEEPYLRALHARHGQGAFPFDIVCTHAIACRLLPQLPRRTLRALAGYFGAGVPPQRRAADHVVATAFVWQRLVALLEEREGVASRAARADWLARPVRRAPRAASVPARAREAP